MTTADKELTLSKDDRILAQEAMKKHLVQVELFSNTANAVPKDDCLICQALKALESKKTDSNAALEGLRKKFDAIQARMANLEGEPLRFHGAHLGDGMAIVKTTREIALQGIEVIDALSASGEEASE